MSRVTEVVLSDSSKLNAVKYNSSLGVVHLTALFPYAHEGYVQLLLKIIETVVCDAVKLYCVLWRGVSVI